MRVVFRLRREQVGIDARSFADDRQIDFEEDKPVLQDPKPAPPKK